MNSPLHIGIAGVGLLGPGLADWTRGAPLLRTPRDWTLAPTVVPAPERLPPTERRRASVAIRAAVVLADQACAMAGADPAALATVFTSASGDPAICHAMCEAMAQPDRLMSPTRFTNSVHNAPAGYWHIAVQSRCASTSLAAWDASANAGLLEAAAQCTAARAPVLLVASDMPYPEPLHALRPLPDVFGFALLLVPPAQPAPWRVSVGLAGSDGAARCDGDGLERLRQAIPAARALPLLQTLARQQSASLVVEAGGLNLALQVQCA
ncbi:MAG: beta-ketoacyl synthase chain length factor [Burkholderiaceae bacterium]|nr:beta-ketoacyl synthase chain length factor [Burkholderiaceae bacterium]